MRWFTSDEHYGHENIIKFCERPFYDAYEMELELVRRHNSVVGKNDEVWHLGDFVFGDTKEIARILSLLNGVHTLISGNHDKCHPCHKKHATARQRYLDAGFDNVFDHGDTTIEGLGPVLVCHLPPWVDSVEAVQPGRGYKEFRPDSAGIQLCGHVHEKWKRRGNVLNVGVDQWNYTPISEAQIAAELKDLHEEVSETTATD